MNSRDKGKRGELELCQWLRDHGVEAQRGVQYQGSPGSPDVVSELPIHIEVKRVERLCLRSAVAQAARDSAGKKPWMVAHRWNNGEWLAIVPLEFLVELMVPKEEVPGQDFFQPEP